MALVCVRLFRLFYGSAGKADTEKGLLQILVLLQQPRCFIQVSFFHKIEAVPHVFARIGEDGPLAAQRAQPAVGRNDPYPCGSGKKYKKCCGRNLV